MMGIPRRRLAPLNALRAFEAAARVENFREASIALGVTHGAVAQQVRALERLLGVQLFTRQPRGLKLTKEGRELAGEVSRAFDLLMAATAGYLDRSNTVVISVPPTFASKVLVPKLGLIEAALPDVQLRTIATPDIADLRAGGTDIAVRMIDAIPAEMEGYLLFNQELIAVASSDLVKGRALPLSIEDLKALPAIHDAHDHWRNFLPDSARKGIRFNQTTLALDAAIAGLGVALVCRAFVETDLADGKLLIVSDHTIHVNPSFFMLRRPAPAASDAAERFWAWAKEHWGSQS